jgi:hypothetical protein
MRRLAPLFLLCLAIDFTNPMLPGSVRFDPSESVEATHASPYQEVDGWGRPAGESERVLPIEQVRSTPAVALGPVSTLRLRPPTARHRPRESDARPSASATEDH